MHPWLLLWMTVDSFSSYRTSCYGSTTLVLKADIAQVVTCKKIIKVILIIEEF